MNCLGVMLMQWVVLLVVIVVFFAAGFFVGIAYGQEHRE